MKIAIFGSTGYVGKVLMQKALNAHYEIKTLVRNPEKLAEWKNKVEYVSGNVFDPPTVLAALTGTEVVLSTIGPPQRHPSDPHQYEQAMMNLISAMAQCGIRRLIHIGGAAHAGGEHEQWSLGRRFLRAMLTVTARPILEAKRLEWEVLKRSAVDWTLVRPPAITRSAPRGTLYAEEKYLASITVNLEDLAEFMLQQITAQEWLRKAPLVSSRKK